MKSFKSTASKIENPRFFLTNLQMQCLISPSLAFPGQGAVHPSHPLCTPLHVPDLKCVPDLKRVPDFKNAILILTFFPSHFCLFHVCSFNNLSNIFKKAFYVFVLNNSVRSRERTIVPQEQRPALPLTILLKLYLYFRKICIF